MTMTIKKYDSVKIRKPNSTLRDILNQFVLTYKNTFPYTPYRQKVIPMNIQF